MLDELKQYIRELIQGGEADLVIGYGLSGNKRVVPLFARRAEDADRLVWNDHCYYNLARYLTDRDVMGDADQKTGIIVKGCDLKTLNVLLAEKQVKRERLKIIALRCEGMKDSNGQLLAKCETCTVADPDATLCDTVIGPTPSREPRKDDYADVEAVEAMLPAERLAYWSKEFERCIRCNACRNICPLCYCRECVASQHDPQWIPVSNSVTGNRVFHIVRALHMAGRCTNCGECERVCPVGIPLNTLMRKMARTVQEDFGFEAGASSNDVAALASFGLNDPDPEQAATP